MKDLLIEANTAYRAGDPIMDDATYDALADLYDPFDGEVEPEPAFGAIVELPELMLSTQKAYSLQALQAWATSTGATEFRITPKLDGFSGYDTGTQLITRGGSDITHAVKRGLQRGLMYQGKGEIVVDKTYFEARLSHLYSNTRNVIAAAIRESEPDEEIMEAITQGYIRFVPFAELQARQVSDLSNVEYYFELLTSECEYDTDGIVIEAIDCEHLGHTSHHFRWQIAFKKNTEFHDVAVRHLTWQTARTGRITPVVELEPTLISGVTVSRATGHHRGNVVAQGIDTGAVVRVCRSGQVIPYIAAVVTPASHVKTPAWCPACNSPTHVEGDNLLCKNPLCEAQAAGKIEFFFKELCDGFGPVMCDSLVAAGYTTVRSVYEGTHSDRLMRELYNSVITPVEPAVLLAAFGIPGMGVSMCEKLLAEHAPSQLTALSEKDLLKIPSFGGVTAKTFVAHMKLLREDFEYLWPKFTLKTTLASSPKGATVCFTGTMSSPRAGMEAAAREQGYTVVSSVTSKTDILVCGANVGANKTAAAQKFGTKIMTEEDWVDNTYKK